MHGFVTVLLLALTTYGTTNIKLPTGKVVKVELAMTADELAKGMSGLKSVPEEGMLLVYKAPTRTSYHLMAYPGPVDIAYLDENKKIINLKRNAAPCALGVPNCGHDSVWLHIYALQLPPGSLERLNLHAGDTLSFEVPETPPF